MSDDLVLLHNPRCSKSREALALLEARGSVFTLRRYLDEPLDLAQLRALHAALGTPVRAMLREDNPVYAERNLGDPATSDEAVLAAIADTPALLQRPILWRGERAVIGRPPARIVELLDAS